MIQIYPANGLNVESDEAHRQKMEFLRRAGEEFANQARQPMRAWAKRLEQAKKEKGQQG